MVFIGMDHGTTGISFCLMDDDGDIIVSEDVEENEISDIETFAATLNRNCFKGAVNFIITVILAHNPYARIVIVSDYN